MTIKDIRKETGLSQSAFAQTYGIPVGTLRNWEQGLSKPPKYVLDILRQLILATVEFKEYRFDEPVSRDTYTQVVNYCNQNEIAFNQFCILAMKAMS